MKENESITITVPRWVLGTLIVAGQCEHARRRDDHPNDPDVGRFNDAWRIVHRYLEFGNESGDKAVKDSQSSAWRALWPDPTLAAGRSAGEGASDE